MVTKEFNIKVPVHQATKSATEEGIVYLEGLANTGQEDLVGDIVTREALQQIVDQATNRNLHLDHERGMSGILGPIVESELRDEGVWIKSKLVNERKDEILSYIEQGVRFGHSISGKCTYEEDSWSNIIEWDLTEISLTDMPCDQGTMGTVQLSKSFDSIIEAISEKQRKKEENKKEDNNGGTTMAEEPITLDQVTELINTAFNERKEEFLESIRGELKDEYEAVITELKERIETLEGQLEDKPDNDEGATGETGTGTGEGTTGEGNPGKEGNPDEEEDKEGDEEEEDKDFKAIVEKEVEKRVKEIFGGVAKSASKTKYAPKVKSEDSEKKSFTPKEIAQILTQ